MQAWREADELKGRELMRYGRWRSCSELVGKPTA
jgi:hypothetical protein